MAAAKKRKIDAECRVFNNKWSEDYFCTESNGKLICLICKEPIAVFKEYNVKRHYETKHKEKYRVFSGELRLEKVEALKKGFAAQQNIFKKRNDETVSALRASYRVAHIVAECGKPFTDGELVKKCMMQVVEEMCPDKKSAFESVSLSASTVTRRIEDINGDLLLQLQEKSKNFEFFSLALDESNDMVDTAQLLVFIRGIDDNFEIIEELAALQSMKGTTTGEDLFLNLSATMDSLNLDCSKLKAITTDGAKSMSGTNIGLMGRINQHMDLNNFERPMALHCIIHQQALCGKSITLQRVMNVVIKTVNFIRSHGLNHRQFQFFLSEIECEYGDVIYHSEVRWLSRGKVLKRFLNLLTEINIFMAEKGRPIHELSDPAWIWELCVLCDITDHINNLNLKLQGEGKLICNVYSDVKAFETKLRLFHKQLSENNLAHFESCNKLSQDKTIKAEFPKEFALDLIKSLQQQFSERFRDFHHYSKDILLFENPFSADIDTSKETLQMELIELQSSKILKAKFNECKLVEFYKCLPDEQFSKMKTFARGLLTVFGSTYTCEQTFSRMKLVKSKLRTRMTDDHLHAMLRIGVSRFQPNFEKLAKGKQPQVKH